MKKLLLFPMLVAMVLVAGCGQPPPLTEGCQRMELTDGHILLDLCLGDTDYDQDTNEVKAVVYASSPENRTFPEISIGLRAGIDFYTDSWLPGSSLVWVPLKEEMKVSGNVIVKDEQKDEIEEVIVQFDFDNPDCLDSGQDLDGKTIVYYCGGFLEMIPE